MLTISYFLKYLRKLQMFSYLFSKNQKSLLLQIDIFVMRFTVVLCFAALHVLVFFFFFCLRQKEHRCICSRHNNLSFKCQFQVSQILIIHLACRSIILQCLLCFFRKMQVLCVAVTFQSFILDIPIVRLYRQQSAERAV